MLEDCGMIIQDMGDPNEVFTAEYIDQMYGQIHAEMYYNNYHYDRDKVAKHLGIFVRQLCRYLQSEGLLPITTAQVKIGGSLSPITLRFELSTDRDIVIKTLGYSNTSAWYGRHLGPTNLYLRSVFGTKELIPEIRRDLGYRDCLTCRYSDNPGKYCGLGIEMYTGKCMNRVYVHPYKKSHD